MENELQKPLSPETLREALVLLQPEEAKDQPISEKEIEELREKVSTEPRRGTDFIAITAAADTKKEALKLSEAVTKAYIEIRRKEEIARAQKALKALDDELVSQSEMVQEQRKELTVLIQQYGIPYFEDGQSNPLGMTEHRLLQNARTKLEGFETMRDQIKVQIEKLLTLKSEKLTIYAAALDLPENPVAESYLDYQNARSEKLALLDQGLKNTDAKVIAVSKRIDALDAKIQTEVANLTEILKTKSQLVDRQIERMKEMVGRSEANTINLSLRQSQYNQVKEEYEQSRAMLREMKTKQQEARILLKMPREPVTLHEKAK